MNKARVLLLTFFILIGFFVISWHMFDIQVNKHDIYKEIALRQQDRKSGILAERGMIKDRTGKVLAYTTRDYSYYAGLKQLKSPEARERVAKKFSEVFGKPVNHYMKMMNSGKNRVCLEKKAPFEKSLQLRDFVVDGLSAEEDYTRVYPENKLASHVLGYVNTSVTGVNGIERLYEDELKGTDGLLFIQRDVLGKTVGIVEEYSYNPVPGNTIELTINADYQKILEEELAKGVVEFKGVSATGIIIDPSTGAILGMANVPDYDPNSYGKFSDSARKNRAVMDIFEPGSTIKPLVVGMLMDEKLVNLNEMLNTENGTFTYNRVRIRDTHPESKLTVRGVLYESSNIGMVKLSDRIESNTFYRYLRDFGFGNPTSINLPGESAGFLKKPKHYSRVSKAFMAHGYELSVTPLQMVTALSSLVNGGYLNQPYIVNRIIKDNGQVEKEFGKVTIRRVLSEATSDTLRNVMKNIVEYGTGSKARLDNMFVGGKTGTAQKWTGEGYSSSDYSSSFVGFFPVEDPKVMIFILVNSPQIGHYGGSVAAPIFKETAERIINSDISFAPFKEEINRSGRTLNNLMASVENSKDDLNVNRMMNIEDDVQAIPRLSLDKLNKEIMPDLTGLSKREVIKILSYLSLEYNLTGTGKVNSQSILPGSAIKPGNRCDLIFAMDKADK